MEGRKYLRLCDCIGEKFLNIRLVELASLNRPIQTSGFAWILKLQAD